MSTSVQKNFPGHIMCVFDLKGFIGQCSAGRCFTSNVLADVTNEASGSSAILH